MAALEQRIGFATARDGTRLAYAVHGRGPVLVSAAHWLTHLQYDWESPIWQPFLAELGSRYTVVRYDERGCGLSDREVEDFSLDAWVEDLETVVDAAGLDRFALLGVSQGTPVAIRYAAAHPERVSHLVLYGGYLRGFDHRHPTDLQRQARDAMTTLIRIAWGSENPTFRRLYTSDFVPDGDEDLLRAYDELLRRTTTPADAARFEAAFAAINVRDTAPRVTVPTLVMHLDDDRVIPLTAGQEVAAAIPHARFALLPGHNHVIQPDEPAWERFFHLVDDFLAGDADGDAGRAPHTPLTMRELDVMALVRRGLGNDEIAAGLGISPRTVERHLSNVYVKLGLTGKGARAAAAAATAHPSGTRS
ncbi:alpha/beta fold hydrolase [Georgenia muralis]